MKISVAVMLAMAWLIPAVFLAGCAPGVYQRSMATPELMSDVPPSFYGNDPSLRHWYVAPYWNHEAPG